MATQSLPKKLEVAIAAYLKQKPGLTTRNCYPASTSGARELPCLVVLCNDRGEAFPGAGINCRNIEVTVYGMSAIDGDQPTPEIKAAMEADHDQAIELAQNAIYEIELLKAFVSPANVLNRPVTALHLYDLYSDDGDETEFEERRFGNCLKYKGMAEANDFGG